MNHKDEKISIIVPIYQVQSYLTECIESIVNQSYDNLEIILVDDGSTDGSINICRAYEAKDSRILVIQQSNQGVSAARNAGIQIASGSYIGFVDGDDIISLRMYEKLKSLLTIYRADVCVCTKIEYDKKVYDTCSIRETNVSQQQAIHHLLKMKFPSSLCNTLYKAHVIKNLRLNENIAYWEDYEFQIRAIQKAKRIALCHEPLYYYRKRENSANHQNINNKIFTCMLIPELVKASLYQFNGIYDHAIKNLAPMFLQYIIAYLGNSSLVNKESFHKVTVYSRRYGIRGIFISDIKFLMKVYLLLCMVNSKLFWKLYRYFKSKSV